MFFSIFFANLQDLVSKRQRKHKLHRPHQRGGLFYRCTIGASEPCGTPIADTTPCGHWVTGNREKIRMLKVSHKYLGMHSETQKV